MFTYFHQHKLKYERGQLLPVFIVVLAVILIMAMVTVNLSKVSSIKTDSANAVDAGGLAAGSAMANVFNSVASANADFEKAYWTFYSSVSASFTIALASLTYAMTLAPTFPCSAFAPLGYFTTAIWGILLAVTAYWIAMEVFYNKIRKMADEGRESAVKVGHKFSFMNSGIGAKLKNESIPADTSKIIGNSNNYYSSFSKFMENIAHDDDYTYSWNDGQQRQHSVHSQVKIDKVQTYNLQVTALPGQAVIAALSGALDFAYSADVPLTTACSCFWFCIACCNWPCLAGCPCCISYPISGGVAAGLMGGAAAMATSAWTGLLPGWVYSSNNTLDATPFIICWIDDIKHNRQVKLDNWQDHQGANLEIWQAQYPRIHSYSLVDFRWKGQIHPPKLEHDASIIATDQIGK